jgi:BioD-like phosphotransacetylase family protein
MKAIFVTSVEPYTGKSAVCLAIGKKLQNQGFTVGSTKHPTLANGRWNPG